MTGAFPPRAHFPLRNWTTWRAVRVGEIFSTKNFASRDRRFGSKRSTIKFAISGMKILTTVASVNASSHKRAGKRRVLVPTMGALHKAHRELIRVAREHAGKDGGVAVSIFVNPLQFEPRSDYERYPRPEKADEDFCRDAGVDLLFRPSIEEMYFDDRSTFVEEISLSSVLEGKSRPGHFRGVCTVVAKLFNVLTPDAAVFGEKDFQQLAIVPRMGCELNFNIDIIAGPTVREEDGLACSSRNQDLKLDER